MGKIRYSVEQVIGVLNQAEPGVLVGDIARKLGISEQSFYRWKKKHGGKVTRVDESRFA